MNPNIIAFIIIRIAVIAGIIIAIMIERTFNNMQQVSRCFKQIATDLERINQIIKETKNLFKGRLK